MWLSHTRPDDMFEVSHLTQVTAQWFENERCDIVKHTNRTVQYVKDHRVSISFPKLDLTSLYVVSDTDTDPTLLKPE